MQPIPTRLFCTVVTRSYLPYARCLASTLACSGNPEPLHVLVADAEAADLPDSQDNVILHAFDQIAPPPPEKMRHYFDAFELCNALKPFIITHLFALGVDKIIYLDADIMVTDSFSAVWDGFGTASLLVTGHCLHPPKPEDRVIKELDIVDMGFINGGFTAWMKGPAAEQMLGWLRSRLPLLGFDDERQGMYTDQKLLPMLVQYFPTEIRILQHPGLNIAYWNALERDVRKLDAGRWRIGEIPVIFFHFSGYRVEQPEHPCKYLDARTSAELFKRTPWLPEVLGRYHSLLATHLAGNRMEPYRFGTYDGVTLTKKFRQLLFRTGCLDRGSTAFWKIWIFEKLRRVKHRIVALRAGK